MHPLGVIANWLAGYPLTSCAGGFAQRQGDLGASAMQPLEENSTGDA
ncbi:TPA: hypothetical protein ACGSTL_001183 [Vibrio parahaemolyticus]